MNKDTFINWLETKTNFEPKGICDSEWSELVDHDRCIWDDIIIEDTVTFIWEKRFIGSEGLETNEYTFEDFVMLYESNELKNINDFNM